MSDAVPARTSDMNGPGIPAISNGIVELRGFGNQRRSGAWFVVLNRDSKRAIGLIALHDENLRHGFASVSAIGFPAAERSLLMTSAILLFLEFVFSSRPLRKLYFHVPEYEYARLHGSLNKHLRVEAQLKDHVFAAGRHWDRFTLSLFREQWEQVRFEFRALIGGEP